MKLFMVKKVSQLSGVSIRTLHYYDEIGLLKPAQTGKNGYRYYEWEQLLLLQQILFYRRLGFSLEEIRRAVGDPRFDKLVALRSHKAALEKDALRVRELIETIDKTIANLEGETTMKAKEMFWGFDSDKQKQYEQELVERFGDSAKEHIAQSHQKVKGWTTADWERCMSEYNRFVHAMAEHVRTGSKASASAVQDLVRGHYKWLSRFWTPTRESYAGHGRMLAEHPDWRKRFDPIHPGLADFLAEAMVTFADSELK